MKINPESERLTRSQPKDPTIQYRVSFPLVFVSPLNVSFPLEGGRLALLNMNYLETTDLKCTQQPIWNMPPEGHLFNRVKDGGGEGSLGLRELSP